MSLGEVSNSKPVSINKPLLFKAFWFALEERNEIKRAEKRKRKRKKENKERKRRKQNSLKISLKQDFFNKTTTGRIETLTEILTEISKIDFCGCICISSLTTGAER